MIYIHVARGAKTIIEKCAFVKEGESVFIITDYARSFPDIWFWAPTARPLI